MRVYGNLTKASQDALLLIEIWSFLAGVEFEDGFESVHVNGVLTLNSVFLGEAKEVLDPGYLK